MDKISHFIKEIEFIKNEDIKVDLKKMINEIPQYFFEIPASSSGKYHPSFAQGEGGLLRHTKFAVRVAHDLLELEMFKNMFNERQRDLIIYSLIMHDTFKCGKEKSSYTLTEHPLIAAQIIDEKSTLSEKDLISSMIKSHMGQWHKDRMGNEVLPKPETECEKFVHICDYLASKKYLDSKFVGNEIYENVEEEKNYVRS